MDIPKPTEPLVNPKGHITKNWYNYLLGQIGESAINSLQQQIDALWAAINDGSQSDVSITGSFSVQVFGTAETGYFVQLRNDTPTPDPDSYYGTDADGVRGYHALPSDMVPYFIASDETYTVPLYKQALFAMPIDVAGFLIVDGFLTEVA